jgi:hypothetical protein
MSSVLVVAPVVVAAWPMLSAAVTAAIGTMGFAVARNACGQSHSNTCSANRAEIEVEESEILADAGVTSEQLMVERDGIRATFSRDARGCLKLCMEGEGVSKDVLKKTGQELIGRVTQQYVYHKLVTELKDRQLAIVDEQVAEDRSIRIRVRNW